MSLPAALFLDILPAYSLLQSFLPYSNLSNPLKATNYESKFVLNPSRYQEEYSLLNDILTLILLMWRIG
jgi:hypothetical protein